MREAASAGGNGYGGAFDLANVAHMQHGIGDLAGEIQTYKMACRGYLKSKEYRDETIPWWMFEIQKGAGDEAGGFASLRNRTQSLLRAGGSQQDGSLSVHG